MRLRLIYALIKKDRHAANKCLDFGGGGGVFLPTLSRHFRSVICIDLENSEARKIVEQFNLSNVELVQADISTARLAASSFDVIVAADVLEHFRDLSVPVNALRQWLSSNGVLYTSLPTENYLYIFLRRVFDVVKPWDHYHTGEEVEEFLTKHGFERESQRYVPLYFGMLPLFLISSWILNKDTNF